MEREYDQGNSHSNAFLRGLFAGTMIGAGIGLLFAPRRGSELRRQVADSAASASRAASKTVDELSQRGREAYQRARDVASRAGESVERVANDAAKVADKVLSVAGDLESRVSRANRGD
jgi:gas vesicle protein